MSRHKRIALRVSSFVLDYLLALPIGCAAALALGQHAPGQLLSIRTRHRVLS